MGTLVLFSLASALNPTLLTATTGMLLLPHPERLMLGYWFGAMVMSIVSGMLLIYVLHGTAVANATKETLSPIEYFAMGAVALTGAALLASGAVGKVRARRASRHQNKPKVDPKWEQRINNGTAATTVVLGAALSLPGATYLLLLAKLSTYHYSWVVTALILFASNLIQLIVLEVPMLSFRIWPTQTPRAIDDGKAWVARDGARYGAVALSVIGVALIVRGITHAW